MGTNKQSTEARTAAGSSCILASVSYTHLDVYKRQQEILDNGPLRFTVKLEFNPLVVRGDSNVVETRVISLDAGSYLNKTVVSYTNLKEAMPVTTGLVLREPDGAVVADAANGYITYVDPTTDRSGANGKIFVGAAFPAPVSYTHLDVYKRQDRCYSPCKVKCIRQVIGLRTSGGSYIPVRFLVSASERQARF